MNFLKRCNALVSRLNIWIVIVGILGAGCNMAVPYYLSMRETMSQVSDHFLQLLSDCEYDILVQNGKLVINEVKLTELNQYLVSFNSQKEALQGKNYIDFQESGVAVRINKSELYLPYMKEQTISLEEIKIAIVGAIVQLSSVSMISAFAMGLLHVLFLMSIFLMTLYFVLLKRIKYRDLIKYATTSLFIASLFTSMTSLIISNQKLIMISAFTIIGGMIQVLLILPTYSQIKAEDYI